MSFIDISYLGLRRPLFSVGETICAILVVGSMRLISGCFANSFSVDVISRYVQTVKTQIRSNKMSDLIWNQSV